MDLYLDDCADSDHLAGLLRQAGHRVYSPRTEATRGIDDPDHLAYAAARGYTLITKNRGDFSQLHQEWRARGQSHAGILLVCADNIRGKDMEPGDIVRAISNLLASGLPIANELNTLNHWR
jgi:hypothetical protein